LDLSKINPNDSNQIITLLVESMQTNNIFTYKLLMKRLDTLKPNIASKIIRGVIIFLNKAYGNVGNQTLINLRSYVITQRLMKYIKINRINMFLRDIKNKIISGSIKMQKIITLSNMSISLFYIDSDLMEFYIQNNIIKLSNKFKISGETPTYDYIYSMTRYLKKDLEGIDKLMESLPNCNIDLKNLDSFYLDQIETFNTNAKIIADVLSPLSLLNISKLLTKENDLVNEILFNTTKTLSRAKKSNKKIADIIYLPEDYMHAKLRIYSLELHEFIYKIKKESLLSEYDSDQAAAIINEFEKVPELEV